MADTKSNFAQPFVGLSSNLKFVTNVANGSVWVDADTSIMYLYNLSDNTWYAYTQKVAVDELGTNISDNSNTQLKITPYESAGGEYKQDLTTGAFTIIDYAHHEIHSGSHYKAGYQDTSLATNDVINLLFITPATTTWAHWEVTAQSTGVVVIQVYEDATTTNETTALGTAVTRVNRNRNSTNESGTLVYHTPTLATTGTKLVEKWIGGEGFKADLGGETRGDSEFILKQGSKYLVRLTAVSDGIKGAIGGDWYEHTNR